MSARGEDVAAVVAEQGALPVPAGSVPQPLSAERLAEYAALIERTTPLGAATASPGMAAVLLAEVRRLLAERHETNEWVDDAAEALRENQNRFETLRALCDAAEHVGIVSGGWFTVDAVRRAAAGEPLPKPDGITRQIAPTQALRESRPSAEWVAETFSPKAAGSLEDPHDSPLHHPYTTGRDLDMPETGGAR